MEDVSSLWPGRRERRQAAVARDNEKINIRLVQLEESMKAMTAKIDKLLLHQCPSSGIDVSNLADRIDKIEFLLVRTSVSQFKELDRDILQMLPKCIPTTADSPQPESEISPLKREDVQLDSVAESEPLTKVYDATCCLNFDTFSEVASVMDSSEENDDFDAKLDRITRSLQPTIALIRKESSKESDSTTSCHSSSERQGLYKQYQDLVLSSLHGIFSEASGEPPTQLTWRQVDKQFPGMPKTALWRKLCEVYCKGTCDPSYKSDKFLKAAFAVHHLWHDSP